MQLLTLKEVIDQIEGILAKKRRSRRDLERARQYIQAARDFLAFDRKGRAAPPVICPETLEVYQDGTISCLESRKVLRASGGGRGESGGTLARGLSYDDQVMFCERCQKTCAETLVRLEAELKRLG